MTILEGLQIIDRLKLPHPEWEFVRTSKNLQRFTKVKDYVGWTIRTVEVQDAPWKNLYVNWLPKPEVPKKLDQLQKQQHGKAMFVVYPSWKWKKGGTVLIEPHRIVIEAVRGEIEQLMRKGIVTASYFFVNNRLVQTTGQKDFLTPTERKKILQAAKRLKRTNLLLEWAITTQNKFIFYRIENLQEAARLLLAKYA